MLDKNRNMRNFYLIINIIFALLLCTQSSEASSYVSSSDVYVTPESEGGYTFEEAMQVCYSKGMRVPNTQEAMFILSTSDSTTINSLYEVNKENKEYETFTNSYFWTSDTYSFGKKLNYLDVSNIEQYNDNYPNYVANTPHSNLNSDNYYYSYPYSQNDFGSKIAVRIHSSVERISNYKFSAYVNKNYRTIYLAAVPVFLKFAYNKNTKKLFGIEEIKYNGNNLNETEAIAPIMRAICVTD